jgi:bifunctional non-homologous end joining protein LigD
MAAQPVTGLPEGDEWSYELKLDGYRALLIKDGEKIELRSRNNKNLTRMYPALARAAQHLKPAQLVLDGEIVALDAQGRPSFQALQHRGEHPGRELVYYVFDVLHVNGRDVTHEPLTKRQGRLPKLLADTGPLRWSQALPGSAHAVLNAVRAAGLEGVVAKHKSSPYQAGERSSDWQKLKLEHAQEFVIGGYRGNAADGVDALLVGYYDQKQLRFAGKVRAGMIPPVRRSLWKQLQPLSVKTCPFVNLPDAPQSRWGGGVTPEQMREMNWVKPRLLAQIRFQEWTTEGRLRLAKYLGLRTDKNATDVHREF